MWIVVGVPTASGPVTGMIEMSPLLYAPPQPSTLLTKAIELPLGDHAGCVMRVGRGSGEGASHREGLITDP